MPKTNNMKRILFFDVETNGLPKNWRAPVTDLDNWPEVVTIAWAICLQDGTTISENYFMLGRQDVISTMWSKEAEKVHGVSHKASTEYGYNRVYVLRQFAKIAKASDVIVAHNLSFDSAVTQADHLRTVKGELILPKEQVCTMRTSTELCAIPSPGRPGSYKWPKLEELHRHLFQRDFDGAHNALEDVRACIRCYFEMKKLEVLA
jgi:DNA polymerase-3 subunit epsilon